MASYLASLASSVSLSADAVARSVAPVDQDGATHPRGSGPVTSSALLLRKTAQDVHNIVVKGRPFHLSDLPAYIDAIKNADGGGIDDRKMLLEKLLVLMSRLPSDSKFAQQLEVFTIDFLYKDLPHPPAAYLPLPASASSYPSTNPLTSKVANGSPVSTQEPSGNGHAAVVAANGHTAAPINGQTPAAYGQRIPYAARSADGSGYSTLYPDMGAARKPYARTVPPTTPAARQALPDAGLVFDALLARQATPPSNTTLPSSSPNATPGHTTLPPTDADGFSRHPGGLSSLFFSFADLIIHSVFNTDHGDWSVNDASSYLDLSPLYGSGSSAGESEKVRRNDGTGRLWEDVFADMRVLFMPPNVCALLVLFCRNHNYIAEKLLTINEWGSYTSVSELHSLSNANRQSQDDELYARARLVNCGFFMQVVLGDYVGSILGLVRDGLDWRLTPLAESRELDHTVSPRGEGNVVSLEFNLLYRWHAALSKADTAWTEKVFEEFFETRDYKSITVEQFQKTLAQKLRPNPDVRKWTFDGLDGKDLVRDAETGAFRSADLAAILQAATEASASAFKARGIPEVLRVVEIMGIEQARRWGACTINEFRKFMGLKPYGTFEEWNPDPSIHKTAETLYGHIDNLELHVGLQAEEAKPPIPGAGLCPGYTISRAILADAVALVRGDRFLTTEFTVYNLTSWGYQDCFPLKDDGSYGGMLTRLLYRTLPDYYPADSAYAHFPFVVPQTMRGYLEKLVKSPVAKYSFAHPAPPLPVEVVTSFESVREVLSQKSEFASAYEKNLLTLTKGVKVDARAINDTINYFNGQGRYSNLFGHITEKLLEEKSVAHPGSPLKYVDIIKNVINLVPVYFISTELLGLPIKTEQTPHGMFYDTELAGMLADVCNYVFLNTDPYLDWVLREKSLKTTNAIIEIVKEHLKRLSGKGIIVRVTDSIMQWYTGEDRFSDIFLSRVLSYQGISKPSLASSVFAAAASTAALYAKAIVHVVDFYLNDSQQEARREIIHLSSASTRESDARLYKYAREALRLNPPVSSEMRTPKREFSLGGGAVLEPGQPIYCSVAEANLDERVFGEEASTPNFGRAQEGILGLEDYGLTNSEFFKATVPRVLRSIFKLKNLQRAPGLSGTLNRIVETKNGCPELEYVNSKSQITPFPVSMLVQVHPLSITQYEA
ncbi:heme peroxidase [Phellopilus nigrolimitatus]|nr:heme peroxidase [Phellopilus nigrolimitatus]